MKIPPGKSFSIRQSGQALLIVLLAMAVILTLVLSVSSRSLTEVTVTSLEENALRAFSAAEAGVEDALLKQSVGTFSGAPDPQDPTGLTVSYDTVVSDPADTDNRFRYPRDLLSGETATFWLVSHAADGQLTCGSEPCFAGATIRFCWGRGGVLESSIPVAERPALEVLLFYDSLLTPPLATAGPNNYQNVKVLKFASDRNAISHGNNFCSGPPSCGSIALNNVTNCLIDGQQLLYRQQITIPPGDVPPFCNLTPGCLLFIKVRPLVFTSTPVTIPVGINLPSSSLPAQGLQIASTGTALEESRALNVFQSFPEPPLLFDAALFTLGELVK